MEYKTVYGNDFTAHGLGVTGGDDGRGLGDLRGGQVRVRTCHLTTCTDDGSDTALSRV